MAARPAAFLSRERSARPRGQWIVTGLLLTFLLTVGLGSARATGDDRSVGPVPSSQRSSNGSTTAPGLIFDDEFSESSLSPAWSKVQGPNPSANNNEQECYSTHNVFLSYGTLEERASVGASCGADCPPASGQPCQYTSGAVQWRTLDFTYGTVTVRARFAGGTGTWPALWLLGKDCQRPTWITSSGCDWPAPGANEIDIAEIENSDHTVVNQQLHTEGTAGTVWAPGCAPTTTNVVQNWHVYSLVWAPGSLTWMIDGVVTCRVTKRVPTTPMFFIVDTAVGGTGGAVVDNSTLPQTTDIGWVRVTQP